MIQAGFFLKVRREGGLQRETSAVFVFRDMHRPCGSGVMAKAGCGVGKHRSVPAHLPATCSPMKGQSR